MARGHRRPVEPSHPVTTVETRSRSHGRGLREPARRRAPCSSKVRSPAPRRLAAIMLMSIMRLTSPCWRRRRRYGGSVTI